MIGASTLCVVDTSLKQLLWPVAPRTRFLTTVSLTKSIFVLKIYLKLEPYF